MEKRNNFGVRIAEIEELTDELHSIFDLPYGGDFNIVNLLENNLPEILSGFSLQVLPTNNLGKVQAFTEHDPLRIVAREDVYLGALNGNAEFRFTLSHEFGHLLLHVSAEPMLRLRLPRSAARLPLEIEADAFAASLLMPKAIVRTFYNPQELSYYCKVSLAAAERRMRELGFWPRKNEAVTRGFEDLLAYLRRSSEHRKK